MKEFPTLYKMDSAGRIRMWKIWCYEQDGRYYYSQKHGLIDGKKQTTRTEVKSGKNIGKSNETSVVEQTTLEAESLWKKQRDRKGYSENIPSSVPLRPMLAKTFSLENTSFPVYVQPKLDGIRCLVYKDGDSIKLISRQGKEFVALQHLQSEPTLHTFFLQNPSCVLDGELYNHDLCDDFQQLVSAIKRDKPSKWTDRIQYHIYDVYNKDIPKLTFECRLNIILSINKSKHIVLVDTNLVTHKDTIDLMYNKYTKNGYEGIMLRNKDGIYELNKRSSYLQKYKKFIDMEFKIVGAIENKGKQQGQCTLICETVDGTQFGVKPKGTDEERQEYWQRWLDGSLKNKMLTVRFFSWTNSKPPVPRFPVGIAIREYE